MRNAAYGLLRDIPRHYRKWYGVCSPMGARILEEAVKSLKFRINIKSIYNLSMNIDA